MKYQKSLKKAYYNHNVTYFYRKTLFYSTQYSGRQGEYV